MAGNAVDDDAVFRDVVLRDAVFKDSWVTVGVFYSLPALAVARSALEARGLLAQSVGIGLPAVQWPYMVAVGGVELRVPAGDEAEARALLGEGEPVPLRESAVFWANPLLHGLILAVLFPLGIWPHWVRRQRSEPDEAPIL